MVLIKLSRRKKSVLGELEQQIRECGDHRPRLPGCGSKPAGERSHSGEAESPDLRVVSPRLAGSCSQDFAVLTLL